MKKVQTYFDRNSAHPLSMQYIGFVRFIPLVIAGGFFLFTILLLKFGPLDWGISNPRKVYPFLFACLISLILGYVAAVFNEKTSPQKMNINLDRLLLWGTIIYLLLYFPLCYARTGKWFPDIYTGITNTGLAYRMTAYYSSKAPMWIFYVWILCSPVTFLIMPITLFCYSKLTTQSKILGILVITLNICYGIAQGINKHVADITMQLVLILGILLFSNKPKENVWRYRTKLLSLILATCALFLLYYSNSMRNRIQTDWIIGEQGMETLLEDESLSVQMSREDLDALVNVYGTGLTEGTQYDRLWNTLLPSKVRSMAYLLSNYFCQGYKGLSMAMEETFSSSYGLGFSDFFRRNILEVLGKSELEDEILARTYMGKIDARGWTYLGLWSTFFIYPASDISFPGTILLVLLIGYLFGLSWKDTLRTENPFAVVSFVGLCTMVFYFSANNQMFQSGEQCLGFSVSLFLWILSRIRLARK